MATPCAITDQADLYCWGGNPFDLMAVGNDETQTAPVLVEEAGKVEQVALGHQHICALRTDGSVWCAGSYGSVGAERPFGQENEWGPVDLGL